MPEKTLGDRVRRAKREGKAVTIKESDLGRGPVGSHAVKKGRHVLAYVRTADRNARRKRPPGEGRASEPAPSPRAKGVPARRRAAGFTGLTPLVERPGRPADSVPGSGVRKSRYGRMGGIVQGRKKSPSRMGVKQKGGPRAKSRLRGG
ncbi:MAG TPA: hypothetical protein VFB81_17015 [Myxococcales bacterium]|nr:hypothetical protein [Myxococcales bacterium]